MWLQDKEMNIMAKSITYVTALLVYLPFFFVDMFLVKTYAQTFPENYI